MPWFYTSLAELEKHLPEYAGEDEDAYDEEKEDSARVQYKHTLRKLAKAFLELEVPVRELCEGLQADLQRTRPCYCVLGQLARWLIPCSGRDCRAGYIACSIKKTLYRISEVES